MFINSFIGVLLVGTFFIFPSYKITTGPESAIRKFLRIDWVGWVLHSSTIVLINVAFTFSGNIWAWSSAPTIVIWIPHGDSAPYLLRPESSAFSPPQRTGSSTRAFSRPWLLRSPPWGTCMATFCYGVTMYYLPLFFAFARGLTARSTRRYISCRFFASS